VVFTGGIGENAATIRTRICEGLESIGLELDEERNASIESGRTGRITRDGSRLEGWVIPTDEELLIARDTFRVISGTPKRY
jgi:acetate kinase